MAAFSGARNRVADSRPPVNWRRCLITPRIPGPSNSHAARIGKAVTPAACFRFNRAGAV